MSIGLFTDEVIDHFSNPRNTGEMEDANGVVGKEKRELIRIGIIFIMNIIK